MKKKGNWSIYSKVIAEQGFTKDDVPVKNYLTCDHNFWCTNEDYLHQKHIQNL